MPTEDPPGTKATANRDYEASVLGLALRGVDGLSAVLSVVTPDTFTTAQHGALFAVLTEYAANAPDHIDFAVIATELLRNARDTADDPTGWLVSLHGRATTIAALPSMAERLREYTTRRKIIQAGTILSATGLDAGSGSAAVAQALQASQDLLYDVSADVTEPEWETIGSILDDYDPSAPLGPPLCATGFRDLDLLLTGGIRAGQVVIVAARPAVGKSVFLTDIGRYAAFEQGVPSALFSYEMSRQEVASRIIAAEARVNLTRLIQGQVTHDEQARIDRAKAKLASAPLYVISNPSMDQARIFQTAHVLHRRHGVRVFGVDYIGLIPEEPRNRGENLTQIVSRMSRGFKVRAMRDETAWIVVSQLNRGSENRSDHRPAMSDLRDSGSLEQDANVVLLLDRPSTRDPDDRPGEGDVMVVKNRNGATGVVPLVFQGHFARFADLATGPM